jgi:hypothetical protein
VKAWVHEAAALDDNATVIVAELACTEPGCPPYEVVMAVLPAHANPVQKTLQRRLSELTRAEIVALWAASAQVKAPSSTLPLGAAFHHHPQGELMEDTVTMEGRGMTRAHCSATDWRRLVGLVGLVLLMLGGLLVPSAHATEAAEAVTGASPAGHYAFATHGGDGKLSIVDAATLSVTQTVVPTALQGGGYITVIQPGACVVDLIAR